MSYERKQSVARLARVILAFCIGAFFALVSLGLAFLNVSTSPHTTTRPQPPGHGWRPASSRSPWWRASSFPSLSQFSSIPCVEMGCLVWPAGSSYSALSSSLLSSVARHRLVDRSDLAEQVADDAWAARSFARGHTDHMRQVMLAAGLVLMAVACRHDTTEASFVVQDRVWDGRVARRDNSGRRTTGTSIAAHRGLPLADSTGSS